jgi:hypothetical protein
LREGDALEMLVVGDGVTQVVVKGDGGEKYLLEDG